MRWFTRKRKTDGHLHLTDDAQLTLCGSPIATWNGHPLVDADPRGSKLCPVCIKLAGQGRLFDGAA